MRRSILVAGMALGLIATPLIASAQDAPAAPDTGAAATRAADKASMAAPAPKKAHNARTHETKAHRTKTHHAGTKPSTATPAMTDGGDAR